MSGICASYSSMENVTGICASYSTESGIGIRASCSKENMIYPCPRNSLASYILNYIDPGSLVNSSVNDAVQFSNPDTFLV